MNELDSKMQKMENEIDEVIQKRIYTDGVSQMNDQLREKMLDILSACKDMTIATLRPDGWPQANIVGFVNIGLNIYLETFKTASKAKNIERNPRVSITVLPHYNHLMEASALSMGARAKKVTDESEIKEFHRLLLEKFPEIAEITYNDGDKVIPDPNTVLFRLRPEVASILDFTRGFGHADLVPFGAGDIAE